MIYNVSEQCQVAELSSLLSVDRFNEVQSRLRNVGMRSGFLQPLLWFTWYR